MDGRLSQKSAHVKLINDSTEAGRDSSEGNSKVLGLADTELDIFPDLIE